MLTRFKIPKTILWVINLFGIFLLIFTIFRIATFFAFKPKELSFSDLFPSFLMGIRYDLRWIAFILMPVVLLSLSPKLSPFYSSVNKKWWTWYLAIITFVVFIFFAFDFGNFSYNKVRLDAAVLNFVEDAGISVKMIAQSYPIAWLILGLVVAVLFFRWMYRKSHWRVINMTDGKGIPYRRKPFIITAVVLGFFMYGSFAWPPLNWNSAFNFRDSFKSYLALNPFQNFFTTLKFRKPEFNEQAAREAFPLMAEKIQLPQKKEFTYRRVVPPKSNAIESRPNIVLVMCESFSMYKSSMGGNPLNTTPFFNSLAAKGIFFDRCFSPHTATARGLFSIITGIPDVQLFKYSTRNPQALKQHTIIDNFESYSKHYFLGGSPEFNNFDGLLKNINGLQLHTEGSFTSPKLNVWGISDKDLFLEANEFFKKQDKPFFAYIQTSDNHLPYKVPESDTDFINEDLPVDTLKKYGFESSLEYNAFRYSDYCFKKFIEAAQKETYFHNTIFIFIGDHGRAGNAQQMYPPAWTDQLLSDVHIPLLFYAPYILNPQRRHEVVSQIDVLPTIAGLLNQPYVNTTLGRDLLDPEKKGNFAFITNAVNRIGILTDDYYYTRNLNFEDEQLHSISYDELPFTPAQQDSIKQKMFVFASAFFETSRYLILNNKRN